ncbi:MAG: hypothetical protein IAG10_17555 [Planctomycetaceae bacterium]|nr:hypothetical protein [Planctomycetaceae bacterium]
MQIWLSLMIAGSTALAASQLVAQEPATTSTRPDRKVVGVGQCAICHSSELKSGNDKDSKDEFKQLFSVIDDEWVLLDEAKTWATKDMHAQAFTSLLNERSKQMGEALGVKEIHRDKRCLACHTGLPLAAMDGESNLISADLAKDPIVTAGVSCEGCHGPAGDAHANDGALVKGWLVPHMIKDSWRFISEAEKFDKFGFTKIRSVSARTRLCLSCHLGNAAEGKIVTHEMYSKGHPPLPGFELVTFCNQMPKHWRDFDQKGSNVRAEFLHRNENKDNVYVSERFRSDNLHETNNVLVAALVAFSENLKLTAALADEGLPTPVAKSDWPELAQFKCSECHKDTNDRLWRRRRTLRETVVAPRLRVGPTALVTLAVRQSGADERGFSNRWLPIEKLLDEQPFGRRERWIQVTRPLTEWIDDLALTLERRDLRREYGLPLLREMAAGHGYTFQKDYDYESAQQLVWASQVLRRELITKRSPELVRSFVATLDADFADLERLFVLNLIDGRRVDVHGQTVREVDLSRHEAVRAMFKTGEFRSKLDLLARKIAKPAP